MPKDKDRKSSQSSAQDRNIRQQRMTSPSHRSARGGGNRK